MPYHLSTGGLISPATLERLNTTKKNSPTIPLAEETLKPLVLHSSDTVRSLAFSVLVSSLSAIRPYTYVALEILKSCMDVLHLDPDAKFRNEVLSNTKHMNDRLRGATSFMARELEILSYQPETTDKLDGKQKQEQNKQREEIAELLQAHKDFLAGYMNFLLQELIPTASYQRHITSLKAILILLRSGIHGEKQESSRTSGSATSWPLSINFFTSSTVRLLMDLLLDPFEDVRTAAANILRLASPRDFDGPGVAESVVNLNGLQDAQEHSQEIAIAEAKLSNNEINVNTERVSVTMDIREPGTLSILVDFIDHAQTLSKQTGRADYADGLARSYELLCYLQSSAQARYELILQLVDVLEEKLECAENSLGQAVLGAPIHGDFAALRCVVSSARTKAATNFLAG
jgi:hypothetical protein